MEDGKAKQLPSLPANYLTIVELQERWFKERQRKEEEERRLKERAERDAKRVEPDYGPRSRRYPPSNNWNARSRRDDLEVGHGGEREGLGLSGDGGKLGGRERRWRKTEGGPGRVAWKSEDVVVEHRALGKEVAAEIEGKLENLSVKGVGGEISDRANAPATGRSRMNVNLQFVPKAQIVSVCKVEIVPVNEESRHRSKPPRNGRDRVKMNVDIDGNMDKVLILDQRSGSNTDNNRGNKMARNVDIDGKWEKARMGDAMGRSSTNTNRSNGMDRIVNAGGKLEKVLTSGARGGSNTSSNAGGMMDGTVDTDGKLEKVMMSGARGGSSVIDQKLGKELMSDARRGRDNGNGSNRMDGTMGIAEKLGKELSGARGSGTSSNGNVGVHGKLETVPMSGARGASSFSSNGSSRMGRTIGIYEKMGKEPRGRGNSSTRSNRTDGTTDIDEKLGKEPVSGARRGRGDSINGGNRMDMAIGIDEQLGKEPISGARRGSDTGSNGNIRMDGTMGVDEKLEKVPMRSANVGGNTSSGGNVVNKIVHTESRWEKVPMSSARVGGNTSNGGNVVNKIVHTESRREKVPVTGWRRSYFGPRAVMACNEKGGYHKPGMVWVKKGEVSDGNAGGIRNSCGSSKGSE